MRYPIAKTLSVLGSLFLVVSVCGLSYGQEKTAQAKAPAPADSSSQKSTGADEKEKSKKDEEEKPVQPFDIASGKLGMKASGAWKKMTPKVRMIEHEFQIPAKEGDKNPGRLTVMSASGPIDANIARWKSQFSKIESGLADGKPEVTKKTVADQTVHSIKLSGVYKDRPKGFFGPVVEQEDYVLLAAILETKNAGKYFFKLYGPRATIEAQEEAFQEMLDSLEAK